MDRWLNVIDATFNFHLLEAGLAETWAVNRPAPDRSVLSLEALDFAGNRLLQSLASAAMRQATAASR